MVLCMIVSHYLICRLSLGIYSDTIFRVIKNLVVILVNHYKWLSLWGAKNQQRRLIHLKKCSPVFQITAPAPWLKNGVFVIDV